MPYAPAPAVLNDTPTITDVAAAVNRTNAISQLSTNSASVDVLSIPALPKLNATINLERDKKFRLQAKLPIVLGSGLDMGSNDQVFWFEVPATGVSRTLYFANHDQYRQQLNQAILPVDPSWVMDAMGLVQLDPSTVVAGPVRRNDGKLEVRSIMSTPAGAYQRVCLIDPAGFVTHQYLYEPSGRLIATSEASKHEYFQDVQCSLPHSVKIDLQPSVGQPLSMQIDMGLITINQLLTGDPQIFTMPRTASNAVDLTKIGPGASMVPTSTVVPASPAVAPMNYISSGQLGPMPLRGTVSTKTR